MSDPVAVLSVNLVGRLVFWRLEGPWTETRTDYSLIRHQLTHFSLYLCTGAVGGTGIGPLGRPTPLACVDSDCFCLFGI